MQSEKEEFWTLPPSVALNMRKHRSCTRLRAGKLDWYQRSCSLVCGKVQSRKWQNWVCEIVVCGRSGFLTEVEFLGETSIPGEPGGAESSLAEALEGRISEERFEFNEDMEHD